MEELQKIKNLATPVIFGAMWGVFEMFIGSYLHILNFPFRGAFMAGCGGIILCVCRFYSPKFGSILYSGITAALIKIISFGGFKLGPVTGILIESIIVEIIFLILKFNFFSVFISCILACMEAIPHFFVTNWIIYGGDIFGAYLVFLKKIALIIGLSETFYFKIVVIWILGHIFIGVLSGLSAIYVLKRLKNER